MWGTSRSEIGVEVFDTGGKENVELEMKDTKRLRVASDEDGGELLQHSGNRATIVVTGHERKLVEIRVVRKVNKGLCLQETIVSTSRVSMS